MRPPAEFGRGHGQKQITLICPAKVNLALAVGTSRAG